MTHRPFFRRLSPLSACLAVFALVGCFTVDNSDEDDECDNDSDCDEGQVCDDGDCEPANGGSGGTFPGSGGTGGGTTGTCATLCQWSVGCGFSTAAECTPACEDIYAIGGTCRSALDAYTQCIRSNSSNCNAGMTTGPCYSLGESFVNACTGDEACPFTLDGECDEPEGTNLCPEGTDAVDCSSTCVEGSAGDTCVWACDYECDEPDLCAPGTDSSDCGGGV